jgi:predicted transglutaminase-like cysteine proteinase
MSVSAKAGEALYASLGETARSPIGWVEFCAENRRRMPRRRITAARHRDVADGVAGFAAGQQVGQRDHQADHRHGSLGCGREMVVADGRLRRLRDYVLLKRKMLIDAGWPREALLITVVRDKKGEGHAVLTVKSDKGEFVLDNQNENVLAWTETGYRFVKRQSQSDPNVWVSLGDSRPAVATASSRDR